ncbi:MAG: hypothetical protein FWC13_02845 [Oscillospiraceae bacterium]|nr:hypothetical protein [Oscillospiraceae bacterium]
MNFFKQGPRTAGQKAQAAKTRLTFRAIALGFIVFFVIMPMLDPNSELAEDTSPTVLYLTAAGFSLAVIAIGIVTAREYFKSKKDGLFDAEAYTDDEGIPKPQDENSDDNSDISDEDEHDEDEDEYESDDSDEYEFEENEENYD